MAGTPHAPSLHSRFSLGWIILTLSTLCIFFAAGTRSLYAIFYLAQVQEFGWSRGAGSAAYTVNLIVFVLGLPLLGTMLDRWGPRVVFSLATAFTALGLGLGIFTRDAWHFILSFGVIAGIGFTANSQPLHTSVLANWFTSRRGLAIGIATSGAGISQAVLSPVLQKMINAWGWRFALLSLAVATFLLVPFAALFFSRAPAGSKEASASQRSHSSPHIISARRSRKYRRSIEIRNQQWAETEWTLARAIRTWPFWGVMGVSMFQSYSLHFVTVHTVALLVDSGFTPTNAATLYGIMGLGMTIGFFVWGGLSDQIGRETAYMCGTLLFAISVAALGNITPGMGIIVAWLTAFFLGVGFGSRPTLFNLIAVDIFQGKSAGRILGLGATGFGIGGSLGSISGGFIYDYTGSYQWAIWVCLLTLLLAAISAWVAGPSRIRKPVRILQDQNNSSPIQAEFFQ